MSIRFDGKVAIVTGAGGGLGRSHALELARRGAKVVVNDLGGDRTGAGGSSEAANKVVEEIKALGGEAIANGSSVTDDEGVANMVKQTMDQWGRIDILINNAGITHRSAFADTDLSVFQRIMAVNYFGAVNCTRHALPSLLERRGQVNVPSSLSSFPPVPNRSSYNLFSIPL